jgi:hypothetical protein
MPFQKGQSGNPAGRPRSEQSITPWIKRLLFEKAHGRTRAEHIATTLLQMAADGDVNAIRIVLERIDGKVIQPIEQSGTVVLEHVDSRTVDDALDYAAQRRRLRAVS